jgi:signal transduction histidine kinase
LIASGYFIIGVFVMCSFGPVLATWVRHRGFSRKGEAWSILAVLVIGLIVNAGADSWSSGKMEQSLNLKQVPAAERKIGELDDAMLAMGKAMGIFLYFAFGGGLATLAYFSERRRLEARGAHVARLESDMRLAVLQAQIEPHFLFNALAAIRPLIRQDAERAEAAFDALAEHLRATIPQMRAQAGAVASTLGQQLEICASYLKVMQVRMGERLHTEIAVPNELRALEFPPLMLLSLVENAIKHGIEPKPGPGRIVIQAVADGSMLRVRVADDGAGLKDGLSTGLGLANIREQLKVKFAGRARLGIAAQPSGGTVAEITVPLAQLTA